MFPSLLLGRLLAIFLLLLSYTAQAQQPATRVLVVSPAVGEVIDSREKATYHLFPYYTAKEFSEARFVQVLAPDSAITLRTTLTDGRTLLLPVPQSEFLAMRQKINDQARALQPTTGALPPDSLGRTYRVTLRSGTTFAGVLRAIRSQELEFTSDEPGAIIVGRDQIVQMVLIPQTETKDALRHPTWGYVGNGTRVFFAPTARNLQAGEGYAQTIDLFLLGVNYGLTDNFSFGILASALPGVGLGNQFIAITPKVSFPVSKTLSVGAGVLYARIPDFNSNATGYGAGVAYGLATVGSADYNLTFGLGYGFTGGNTEEQGFGKSPVAVLSGATRVSKRLSLMSENYLITSGSGGLGGLYGVRLNWARTTFGIGSFYVAPFKSEGAFGYIYPVYLDLSLRFGKTAQK
ncbi:hypothetical protein SAMN06265337_3328 [Hymenobacter gelipurpurascens]|uniref:Outer membrane protein beta-barrel domain-containing protein n=1 Tax=Hymenobacter gelipurpurascens TaxID=89968 RepID=A0A212UDP6_9BACT|nr:hypothetical protein [Hymenobacter gelipurpurascens]SNC76323.1 hypothetical protein SAMN06265337_3328 [Hymenobacter gelipurpurascens]